MYHGMNALIDLMAENGINDDVTVIGFPCNQFGMQEPGMNNELLNGVKHVRPGGGYVPKFNMTEKLDINGDSSHELFNRLKVRSWIIINTNYIIIRIS